MEVNAFQSFGGEAHICTPSNSAFNASCAFLHNVCMDNGDTLVPDEDILMDDAQPPRGHMAYNETSGNDARHRLAALVSGNVQAP